jgi:hypothetical protein
VDREALLEIVGEVGFRDVDATGQEAPRLDRSQKDLPDSERLRVLFL